MGELRGTECLSQYDLEIISLKRGRGAVICETDQGMMLLKQCDVSEKRIQFEDEVLSCLKENETIFVDDYRRTVAGELAKLIEEKKLNEFRLTYTDDESLYLVTGFGEQETGGYSISVNECYLTETSIVFDTTLIGPSKDETVQQKASYPYIVVKTEKREEPVIFK